MDVGEWPQRPDTPRSSRLRTDARGRDGGVRKELARNASAFAQGVLSRWLSANWLSGYYHAQRNNWIIDLESFENNVNKLNNYCYDEKNFKVPIMEAVERIVGK